MERNSWDTVSGVMTRAVVAVGRDAPYPEIADTLRNWRISSMPVLTGDGRVIGVVSEADLLSAREREGAERAEAMTAGRLMSAPAVTVHPDGPVAEAARTMARRHLKRLPVVDEEEYLVGIVSRADLLKAHYREDEDLAAQVRLELLAALHPQALAEIEVGAEEGRIVLTGLLPEALTAAGVRSLVRVVPGVVDVEVRLAATV
ncbi:CBS domain-containing protein [Kitasatospora sp. NPDC002227]|uniref:CBS domain-containing protein n=1 Tax=Kitasatospora sp. NPDC002227 TaxID=3154773 RepID=UPI003324B89A